MCWFAGFHSLKCFNPPGLCVFLLFFFCVFWTCVMPTLRSNFAIIHSMMNLPVNMFQFTSASCGGVTRDPNKLDAHPRSAMRVMKSAINRLLSSYTDVSGDMTDKNSGDGVRLRAWTARLSRVLVKRLHQLKPETKKCIHAETVKR